MMAHLSFENYEFSKRVARRALIMANKSNCDEIQSCLNVLTQILLLPDSLMLKRLEWILGISQLKVEKPAVF